MKYKKTAFLLTIIIIFLLIFRLFLSIKDKNDVTKKLEKELIDMAEDYYINYFINYAPNYLIENKTLFINLKVLLSNGKNIDIFDKAKCDTSNTKAILTTDFNKNKYPNKEYIISVKLDCGL